MMINNTEFTEVSPYTYVGNDPVNNISPDGAAKWKAFAWGAIKNIGTAVVVVGGVAAIIALAPVAIPAGLATAAVV